MKYKKVDLDAYIRRHFVYNSETGVILRTRRGETYIVGANDGRGYLTTSIRGRMIKLHLIAWFLHYGHWPTQQINHKNGVKTNNPIANLEEVSDRENILHGWQLRNRADVNIYKRGRTYKVELKLDDKRVAKYFKTLEGARRWRDEHKPKQHLIHNTQMEN